MKWYNVSRKENIPQSQKRQETAGGEWNTNPRCLELNMRFAQFPLSKTFQYCLAFFLGEREAPRKQRNCGKIYVMKFKNKMIYSLLSAALLSYDCIWNFCKVFPREGQKEILP